MLLNHQRTRAPRVRSIHQIKLKSPQVLKEALENCDIFLTTPLKFLKRIKNDSEVGLGRLEYVVMDEADKLLEGR